MDFTKCRISKKHKKICVCENNRKFCIDNRNEILIGQVTVDGCLLNDDTEKCDFLFELASKSEVYYVELKGSNIQKAYNQLVTTYKICKKAHKSFNTKRSFIVASRVPRSGPKVQELKIKMMKSFSMQLSVATNSHTVVVD